MLKYKYIHSILQQNKFNVPPLNEMWYSPNMDTINMEKKMDYFWQIQEIQYFRNKNMDPHPVVARSNKNNEPESTEKIRTVSLSQNFLVLNKIKVQETKFGDENFAGPCSSRKFTLRSLQSFAT